MENEIMTNEIEVNETEVYDVEVENEESTSEPNPLAVAAGIAAVVGLAFLAGKAARAIYNRCEGKIDAWRIKKLSKKGYIVYKDVAEAEVDDEYVNDESTENE